VKGTADPVVIGFFDRRSAYSAVDSFRDFARDLCCCKSSCFRLQVGLHILRRISRTSGPCIPVGLGHEKIARPPHPPKTLSMPIAKSGTLAVIEEQQMDGENLLRTRHSPLQVKPLPDKKRSSSIQKPDLLESPFFAEFALSGVL